MLCTASLLSSAWAGAAYAQAAQGPTPQPVTTQAQADQGEIIVTARKRQESILKVPVVMTAVSGEKLETIQVTQITDLPRLVPGLVLAGNLLSIGPQVTIRGVGTSSFDPGVDQSVSLNIDGLSLGQGLAFGSAMFDVGQVEVLKGPQALFFGKSSPGGVISLRTADPTDKFELIGRAGYEFEGKEGRGELIISGPLGQGEGILGRLSLMYSSGQGWWKNTAVAIPGTGAITPAHDRDPRPRNFVLRGTLLFKPSSDLTARLKLNHVFDRATNAELKQLSDCPDGPDQAFQPWGFFPAVHFIGGDDCHFDRNAPQVFLDPAAFPGAPNGGVPYLKNKQNYGTLEINYNVTPAVTLTSVTAYYKLKSSSLVNPTLTTAAAPTFAVTNRFRRREFTQELRANSDFKGPFNFTLGGFFEDGMMYDRVAFIRNRAYSWLAPTFCFPGPFCPLAGVQGRGILDDDRATTVDITTYSLFGQVRFRPTRQLELAVGARWTDETRKEKVFDFQFNQDLTPFLPEPKVHSSTVSPEATITWTPTDDLTAFASYKKGFKSGSFKVAVPANVLRNATTGAVVPGSGENNAFDDEKVQGYEIGIKSRLLDRQLLANIAFYDYTYKGLQVGGIADAVGGVPIITTVNAGKARTYGVDLDLAYHPHGIEGLSLNGSLNWNRARYKELNNIPCYANQTFAQGCTTIFSAFPATAGPGSPSQAAPPAYAINVNGLWGVYTGQDLSGAQMIRAPKWTANFGFDYEFPIGSGMKLQLTNNNQYSSTYPSFLARGRPNHDNFQKGYFKFDAAVTLKAENERWEVALIGKNLTNKLVHSNCSASNTAGGIVLPFGGAFTGGAFPGPMGWAEGLCFPDGPGRTIWVRATVRPFR
jgi:outer membrane receptor protein involved in Fe transport